MFYFPVVDFQVKPQKSDVFSTLSHRYLRVINKFKFEGRTTASIVKDRDIKIQ